MNGGSQTVNVPTSPGKALTPYVESFARGGSTFATTNAAASSTSPGEFIFTVGKASILHVAQNSGGATLRWTLLLRGPSTSYVVAKAQQNGTTKILTSGELPVDTTSYKFSGVDIGAYSYTFWVEAYAFNPQWNGCQTISDTYKTTPPSATPPKGNDEAVLYSC
jgi:hypothetical protein